MACRVARSYQDHTRRDLVSCCECGSAHLEVFSTAHRVGPYLCPICAQSKVECGVAKETSRGMSSLAQAACQDRVAGPVQH